MNTIMDIPGSANLRRFGAVRSVMRFLIIHVLISLGDLPGGVDRPVGCSHRSDHRLPSLQVSPSVRMVAERLRLPDLPSQLPRL